MDRKSGANSCDRGGKEWANLIAVVMKSSAKSDKWKDATALLDYSFDEFTEVSLAAEELRQENYTVTNPTSNEIKADLSAANGFRCLIPNAFTKDDIEIKYVTDFNSENALHAKAVFTLSFADSASWLAELGELELQADIIPVRTSERKPSLGYQENKPSTRLGY